MFRWGADGRKRDEDMEKHVDLHRQHHLGNLPDRHSGDLCYIAGITGVTGQGDDGRRYDSGGQLYCPLHSAFTAEFAGRLCHLHFSRYI